MLLLESLEIREVRWVACATLRSESPAYSLFRPHTTYNVIANLLQSRLYGMIEGRLEVFLFDDYKLCKRCLDM